MVIKNYDEAIDFIHGQPRLKKSSDLNRIKKLMDTLGNPQESLKIVHVTGTNGKGSVSNYLGNLFETAGLRVGLFTSPFIKRFNERFMIDDEMITDEKLVELTGYLQNTIEKIRVGDPEFDVTEFELITAMMFVYFKQENVDVAVIEVGIGGKHDSTNVLTPIVSVIVTVELDHMKLLGDTLADIAQEKAGIIKQDRPVVIGRLPKEARQVVQERADVMHAPLLELGRDFTISNSHFDSQWGEWFDFKNENMPIKDIYIPMVGDFQVQNAAVAIQAFLEYMKLTHLPASEKEIKKGLKNAKWPGRMEKMNDEPLILLDGAHNPAGIDAMLKSVNEIFKSNTKHFLFAGMKDKQIAKMVQTLSESGDTTLTTIPIERAATEIDYQDADLENEFISPWPKALITIINNMSNDDVLVITGSLYFISEVRAYFEDN